MTWRTVILTEDSKISLRLNHLVVKSDKIITVPLAEIGQVIIENPNILMTGHILNALSKHKITTIICNELHLPYSHINLIYGHFRQPKIIKQQMNWPINNRKILWQQIIKHKIYNQKKVLKLILHSTFDQFDLYIDEVLPGDESNREGLAAKLYFNQLFGRKFIRGHDDPLNWALNYGYSLLLALFARVITTSGLLTEIGMHHHSQFNQFNLASDFMEVYRPLVDYIVKMNIVDEFSRKHKRILLNIFNYKVKIRNRNQYLTNSVEIYVDSLIKYLNSGNLNEVSFPYIFKEMG